MVTHNIAMVTHGNPWQPMPTYGNLLQLMATHGNAMVTRGNP